MAVSFFENTPDNIIMLCFYIFLIVLSGCESDKCHCPISEEQLARLNASLKDMDESLVYEWVFENKKLNNQVYTLAIESWFTGHMKTYQISSDAKGYYVESTLSESYIENKRVRKSIKSENQYRLTKKQWLEIDEKIEEECLWVEPISFDFDTTNTDFMIYNLEVFNPQKNPCTGNKYHIVRKQSRADPSIKELITIITDIESLSDLDSLTSRYLH